MSAAPLIELFSLRRGAPRAYCVGGARLVTDVIHPALIAYAVDEPAEWLAAACPPLADLAAAVTFDGEGLIGDGYHHVICREGASGYELRAEGLGAYTIDNDGRIFETAAEPGVALELLSATALGAPLVLALALRGTFCLHASVIAFGEKLVAFIGESGQGKSTLARYLGESGGPGWRRIIDDTLPIAPLDNGPAIALPHFPQLKLAAEMQPSWLVPERLPLSAVYVLDNGAEVAISPLRRREATLALAAQTVGGRLFGRALLTAHLDFCSDLAGRVPVRRLDYPRVFAVLPAVGDALAGDLG